jgi:cytochrome c oxidase subunit IV
MTTGTRATLVAVVFFVAGGVVYAAWSNIEWSGTVLLMLAAGFAAIAGGYVALQARLHRTLGAAEGESAAEPVSQDDDLYLPHSSIWPFELGLGTTITLLGFALGRFVIVLGAAVTVHALVGWIGQSRRRA